MEILGQRLFISHDQSRQQSIVSEYTIKSNDDKLTNIIIAQSKFRPNLIVRDNDGSVLPVMPEGHVMQLLDEYLAKESESGKEQMQEVCNRMMSGELHLIWIKIPKAKAFQMDEIRTITLNYSAQETDQESIKMRVNRQGIPLEYALFTPDEFDFDKTEYGIVKDGKIRYGHRPPSHVEKIKTYNSNSFRISPDMKETFEISYSFRPKSTSINPIRIGAYTLTLIPLALLITRALFWNNPPDMDIFARHVEIGLFIIGGSLIVPQLTDNQTIRAKYNWHYLASIVLGCLMLL